MRRRLIALVLASTLVALTLLGVILISVIWAAMGAAAQDRAMATARVAAAALDDVYDSGVAITSAELGRFIRDDAQLEAVLPDGRVVTAGTPVDSEAYSETSSAGGVTVTASIPKSVNVAKIRYQSGLVVAISVVALAVAMAMAYVYARRLTRPLEDFARMAERIATGDRRLLSQRYGVPELDAVAVVLDRGVGSFNALLENERRVTNEASHQLRTPLTALSLRLEEILATDDLDVVRAEATAALGQVERLAGVIDEVVGLNRGHRAADVEAVDVDELVAGQVTEWAPAFDACGRTLERSGASGLVVQVVPGAQAQALATLLENSLVHGEGTTRIRVRGAGAWVVLEVADCGPGVPAELGTKVFERTVSGGASSGSGLGLALARTLVAADGGRLELLSARPAVFAMFLPTGDLTHADLTPPPTAAAPAYADMEPPSDHVQVMGDGQALVEIAASSAVSASSGNTQRR